MQKFFILIKNNFKFILLAYLLVQLTYIIFSPVEFRSDSLYYYKLAEECIKAGSFYPAPQHLYSDYIIAPLYVNFIIILLKIYNSTFIIRAFNLAINFLQLFLLYKITDKLFNKDTAILTALIYILYLNNIGFVLLNYTELFFGILVLGSIYFYLKNTKLSLFVSGILAAASIAVRPLGWALVISFIIIYVYQLIRKKKNKIKIFRFASGLIIFITLLGLFNLARFGHFIYTATTGSSNLLIGANENATGAFNAEVFDLGKAGYIPDSQSKTYFEKENYWGAETVNWIKAHPFKWVSLIPLKFFYTFAWDDITISTLMNNQDWDLYHILKYIKENKTLNGIMPNSSTYSKVVYFGLQIFNQFYYILIFVLIIMGIILSRKSKNLDEKKSVLLLFSIIGIGITILVYGVPRYKYPFLICCLPFAAFIIETYLRKHQRLPIEK